MCVRLETRCIHQLNDSVNHIHAVAQTAEACEEAPGKEVVDEATMSIVAGPNNPANGKGPGAAAKWLKQSAFNKWRVRCVRQDTPVGTPKIRQHGTKCQHPTSDHPVLGQWNLTSAIACE